MAHLDIERGNYDASFWLGGGKFHVSASCKHTDSHLAILLSEDARKLRDWLNENVKD